MKIASMANVEVPAILALESMGFTITSRVVNADQEMAWTASGNSDEYIAEDPLSLLGLVKLHEVRGDNWKASDDEIDKYLPMLEGDV
ncbi:hypothetical protein [Acaryochloris marina]|uniref:hypothetical protein n=1 Tax=Acaryochloris marina TaxID=155978 RepID=UPI0021C3B3F4|nr:hypothetical protein [Acaryochloris marina]BDM81347.1 hypothetical protein AM10699_42140 [Acaryochloris marina MBIC10699]